VASCQIKATKDSCPTCQSPTKTEDKPNPTHPYKSMSKSKTDHTCTRRTRSAAARAAVQVIATVKAAVKAIVNGKLSKLLSKLLSVAIVKATAKVMAAQGYCPSQGCCREHSNSNSSSSTAAHHHHRFTTTTSSATVAAVREEIGIFPKQPWHFPSAFSKPKNASRLPISDEITGQRSLPTSLADARRLWPQGRLSAVSMDRDGARFSGDHNPPCRYPQGDSAVRGYGARWNAVMVRDSITPASLSDGNPLVEQRIFADRHRRSLCSGSHFRHQAEFFP